MAIKRRRVTLTTGTDGATTTASGDISLGAAYGRILRVEFKGDDANVDVNNTLALTDAEGRIVLTAIALDAGTDDSSVKATNQDYSTVGVAYALVNDEAKSLLSSGAVGTDNVGGGPCVAASPVTVDIAAGTDADVHQITLYVEV
jgi:hypothetical protein